MGRLRNALRWLAGNRKRVYTIIEEIRDIVDQWDSPSDGETTAMPIPLDVRQQMASYAAKFCAEKGMGPLRTRFEDLHRRGLVGSDLLDVLEAEFEPRREKTDNAPANPEYRPDVV